LGDNGVTGWSAPAKWWRLLQIEIIRLNDTGNVGKALKPTGTDQKNDKVNLA
jgi:hypothetical protein